MTKNNSKKAKGIRRRLAGAFIPKSQLEKALISIQRKENKLIQQKALKDKQLTEIKELIQEQQKTEIEIKSFIKKLNQELPKIKKTKETMKKWEKSLKNAKKLKKLESENKKMTSGLRRLRDKSVEREFEFKTI